MIPGSFGMHNGLALAFEADEPHGAHQPLKLSHRNASNSFPSKVSITQAVPSRICDKCLDTVDRCICSRSIEDNGTNHVVTVSYQSFHTATLLFASSSLVLCLLLSLIFHWDEVTKTHCRTREWLCSISTATGDLQPQMFIWRILMGYYSFSKMCMDFSLYFILKRRRASAKLSGGPAGGGIWRGQQPKCNTLRHLASNYKVFIWLNRSSLFTAFVENFSLAMICAVSMSDHRRTHEVSFVAWLISSNVHYIIYLITYTIACSPNLTALNARDRSNLRRRFLLFIAQLLALGLAAVFFVLHKRTCQPGLYSWASLCEWIVVFLNVAFHSMSILEWGDSQHVIHMKQYTDATTIYDDDGGL